MPSQSLLHMSTPSKRNRYFKRSVNAFGHEDWILKSPQEYEQESGKSRKDESSRRYIFNRLDDIAERNFPTNLTGTDLMAEQVDRSVFIELLKRMLDLDGYTRIKPADVLGHPFFTFTHLSQFYYSRNVQSSIHVMDTIAYYKAQAVSQRNATMSSSCRLQSNTMVANTYPTTSVFNQEKNLCKAQVQAPKYFVQQQPPPPSSIPMPPLSWQNAMEEVGYSTEDHSPLYQSPCMESWNNQAPHNKDAQSQYWNPMPFPKWQFHLNTSSPKHFKSEHSLPSMRSGSIFINDSPVGSCSVISISSSSDEDPGTSQDEVKDISMLNVKPTYSFAAQTPSPVTKDSKSKIDISNQSKNHINDLSHYTSIRPKRSRIIPMLQDSSTVQLDSDHIIAGQSTNHITASFNRNSLVQHPEHYRLRGEGRSPTAQENILHGTRFRPKCFKQNSLLSNRRYYDDEFQFSRFSEKTNSTGNIPNDCCTNSFQVRDSCTRCYPSGSQPPVHSSSNHHKQMAHYVPFPTEKIQGQVPPPVFRGPTSHESMHFQSQNTRGASCNASNYSSFTYFSK